MAVSRTLGTMHATAVTVRFTVMIDKGNLGSWTKCEGLAVEHEIQEYQEGGLNDYVHRLPVRRKYPNVKLTRPLDPDSARVASWVSSVIPGFKRTHAEINALDPDGVVICRWALSGVYPVKWTGPILDVGGNQVATESLELAHNGFLEPG
jgi:phage tail-like protein